MTHRLTTDYAKTYCNRALIVKVIVENVVTCFLLGHSVVTLTVNPARLRLTVHLLTADKRQNIVFQFRFHCRHFELQFPTVNY